MKYIGILALQGDNEKHVRITDKAGALTVPLKTYKQLEQVDGLIIPGGESTTIGKLLIRFSLFKPLKEKIRDGFPVFGTCAGAILLAKDILSSNQVKLGTMNITVSRNAYGPQVESFESDIELLFHKEKESFRAIFIRAPIITQIGNKCEVLASFDKCPILVREKNMLVATFHPELTEDVRIHKYFFSMIVKNS